MPEEASIDKTVLVELFRLRKQKIEVADFLKAKGYDASEIDRISFEYKKLLQSQRQFKGFFLLAGGAFLGFISCLLTIINPIPDLYNLFLYGFIVVTLSLLITGLYFIFED